ncbi:uncharacterized protein LOC100903630 [Galendromus occidentalis]|uniref:Uncharacterized protein LOC100903630 n=1 Tax=Galendromus occidentalis TaxID=34638 RepID=A0AAJ6W074_9ACAR|nr:uncharacterized protein LOC100903630 [Galendromus occidentalis]
MSRKRPSTSAEKSDKSKKPGFFDLGSFVSKVKTRDVNILNELAWFSESARTFQSTRATMDIVREFLQMIDCDLSLLTIYMDIFNGDQEAFLQIVFALDNIFVRFQDDDTLTTLRAKVLIYAQRVLSQFGPGLAEMLGSQGDPVVIKPVLKLLTSMVLVGPEVADVFIQSVDLSFFNTCFTRVRIKETLSIRTCAQYLLIALLIISKRNTLWRLVDNRSVFPWAFAGLVHDKPNDVISFLQTVKEKITENSFLSKNQKINVLNKTSLTPVMALLIWRGQMEWRGKEWSRVFLYEKKAKEKDLSALMKGNELLIATPADQKRVRSCAAEFLSAILFDTKQGVVFKDPSLGMGEKNCNFIVTQIVASCSQVFSEEEGALFMADLLVALPDQLKYIIVDRYFNFNSAKQSRTHHHFYNTLARVVTRLDFKSLFAQLEPSATNQYIDLVRHFCLFQFVPKDLSEYSLTSAYSVLTFVVSMLRKLTDVMRQLDRETRRILIPFIKDNLIQPAALTELLRTSFSSEDILTLSDYSGADISDFVLKVLDTMNMMASPLLGYITANFGWSLMTDVDQMIREKVSVINKSKIYLRLMEMIFSFLPDFEEQLVKSDMKPLRLLFSLLAEASTDVTFQVEFVHHAIQILRKFSRLAKHNHEIELWISTVLASEEQEVNHAYSMALCDAVRDCVVKGEVYEKEIRELGSESQSSSENTRMFSPLSAHIVSVDHERYPVFTAVMREILHRQIDYPVYIKFLQKYGNGKLDPHFAHYINFLLKGEKPFVGKGSLNVEKFSSASAMQLETAFVASMTGGHPKSLERVMAKIDFTGENAINVSLLNQLIFIIRWCHKHDQVLFVNPVASCLNNLAAVCDKATIEKLSDFIRCSALQSRYCAPGESEITLLVLTIIRRVMQLGIDVGFDISSLKQKALAAVFQGHMEMSPFIETFKDLCSREEISSLIELVCTSKRLSTSAASLLIIMSRRKCRISVRAVRYLVEQAQRESEVSAALKNFLEECPMHAAALEISTLCRLIEAQNPLALTIMRASPSLTRAVEKNLMSLGELRGSSSLYCLELLEILAQQNTDEPSKEISDFIKHSFLSVMKSCLQEQESDEITEKIADKAYALLLHLRHVVAIFTKDFNKLLKIVLPHAEKPTSIVLVLLNSVLEHGDVSEDCVIALFKCLTKLSAETEHNEKIFTHTCTVLSGLPETFWKLNSMRDIFEKSLKGILKKAFVGRGTALKVLRVVCEKSFGFTNPPIAALSIVEMIFGHSQMLPVLSGKDCPMKQELVHLLVSVTAVEPRNVCKTPHVPILLSGYTATLSLSDQHIFHLLTIYEQNGANLALFRPLIWGEAAPAFYTVDKGTAEVSVLNNATVNQVLSQISQKRTLLTVEKFPGDLLKLDPASVVAVPCGEELYDVRFILTTVYHLLDDLTEVQTLRLVEEKVPLLAIATLSAECSELRALGYTLLSRIYQKMERVSSHPLVMYMIAMFDLIRNSLGSGGTRRINSITMGYLTRSCDIIISDPHNPLYNQLIRNTLSYPAMNLDRLPLLVQNFFASSTAPRERRIWLEKLMSDFVSTNADFDLVFRQGLFNHITMFSLSAMSDCEETVNILRMVQSWLQKRKGFKRFNLLHFWLTNLIQRPEVKQIVNDELLNFLDALTLRLSEHRMRTKEALLGQLFAVFHIQILQMISDVTPSVVEKFTVSFGRVVSLLDDDQIWCIDEHVILIILRMIKEVGSARVIDRGLTVLQKWTPHKATRSEFFPVSMKELWLETLELLFARKSSDVAWNVGSLEMVYRSLEARSDLRSHLLESTVLHDVVSAMVICAESAPLLVIEIFNLLKTSSNAMQELEYQEAAEHLSTLKDEHQAIGYISLIQEAWLGVPKPQTTTLLST